MLKQFSLLLVTLFLLLSGCARPKETNTYIIVKPGQPLRVLTDQKNKPVVNVKSQELKSEKIGNQEIQGWVAMPEEHWKVIKDELVKSELSAKVKDMEKAVKDLIEPPLPQVTKDLSGKEFRATKVRTVKK